MYNIEGTSISVTRGDTLPLKCSLEGRTVSPNTIATMTVKPSANSQDILYERSVTVVDNAFVMPFYPADTRDWPVKTYYWDIRLLDLDTNVYTPMEYGDFTLLQNIGNGTEAPAPVDDNDTIVTSGDALTDEETAVILNG